MAYVRQPGFGDLFNDILNFSKSVLPATGQAIGGDVGDVFTAVGQGIPSPTVTTPAAVPAKPVSITAPGGALGAGGFVEKNQTLLLLGAAALVVILLMGRKKGRR